MSKPTVYVVQMPLQADDNGKLRPRYDVSPAAMYGEIEYLLGPRAAPWDPRHVVKELDEKLHEFSDDDFLLCVGNPILIGIATAIAAQYNCNRVKMLQWSGSNQRYIPVEVNLET